MKRIILVAALFIVAHLGANAQIHVDSIRVVSLGNSICGLALYNVVMPSGPCTIKDSMKIIAEDSIKVALCYMYGNSASQICHSYDTIVIGNISNSHYTMVVSLSAIDVSTNTCANPNRKDTIVLQYMLTGVSDLKKDNLLKLFPNPTSNMLSGEVAEYTGVTIVQISTTTGQLLLQNTITQPNFTIDVSTLPPSLYFFSLTDGRQRVVKRFVKQ